MSIYSFLYLFIYNSFRSRSIYIFVPFFQLFSCINKEKWYTDKSCFSTINTIHDSSYHFSPRADFLTIAVYQFQYLEMRGWFAVSFSQKVRIFAIFAHLSVCRIPNQFKFYYLALIIRCCTVVWVFRAYRSFI